VSRLASSRPLIPHPLSKTTDVRSDALISGQALRAFGVHSNLTPNCETRVPRKRKFHSSVKTDAGMSGRELAKRLTGRYPNLRVPVHVGYTYNVIAQDGTLEEGISFLQKPLLRRCSRKKSASSLDRPVP